MEYQVKNNLIEPEEKVVTVREVLDTIAGCILMVAIFTTLLSLIWTAWTMFKISCTVIVLDLAWTGLRWWMDDLKKRVSK